ncbi:MAG TPA: NADP-dependent oxidoreductase, partial [Puia sp.]|nr:NADP-dependent oxidoreductase [Puia sp.]
KAIILKAPGGVENLQLAALPQPVPGDREVLVQVKAISINPVDAVVRGDAALLKNILHLREGEQPVILGWDLSGVVTDTGKGVSRFKKGDEVFGMVRFTGHGKAYAEYVTAPEDQVALKPAGVSHEEAAAATLAALTAWQALVTYGHVRKGEKVLIHSAAGGVGSYAVQLARYLGAEVIGTSSAANRDFVLNLGATQHIDYAKEKFEEVVNDADLVLDSVGTPGHLDRSLDALKRGGRLISIVTHFTDETLLKKIREKEVFTHRLGVSSNGEDMWSIAGLMEKDALRSFVTQTFPLEKMAAAHTSIESGRTRGKIVVTV